MTMTLKIMLPSHIFLESQAKKIIARHSNGSFCLLPRHVDFIAELVPGIFSYTDMNDKVCYLAVDSGTLVKCADEVLVACQHVVQGDNLETLTQTVEQQFIKLNDNERVAKSALARLEAGVVRRFTQLRER